MELAGAVAPDGTPGRAVAPGTPEPGSVSDHELCALPEGYCEPVAVVLPGPEPVVVCVVVGPDVPGVLEAWVVVPLGPLVVAEVWCVGVVVVYVRLPLPDGLVVPPPPDDVVVVFGAGSGSPWILFMSAVDCWYCAVMSSVMALQCASRACDWSW